MKGWTLALAGLGALCGIAGVAILLKGVGAKDLDRSLTEKAQLLAGRVEQNRLGEVSLLGAPDGDVPFALWRGDGTLVVRSSAPGSADLVPRGAAVGQVVLYSLTFADGRSGRAAELVFVPRTPPGSESPRSPLSASLLVAEERSGGLHVFAIALTVASLLLMSSLFFSTRSTGRLKSTAYTSLARRLEALDAGSLDESLEPADWPAEATPAIVALNELLGRLKKAFDRERGFSANLAHEIRTPLSELRTLAEVAFRWPEDDPEERARVFEEVYAIGLQMERIVDNLLAISRYETGHHALLTTQVSLLEAVKSAWRGLSAQTEKSPVRLQLEIPEDLVVTTDREKLALVLTNLLSNAVAHGEPGVIRCRAEREGDEFRLRLANPAKGLDTDDLGRMFERKWRKDRGDRGRHSGLGLALVATLCRRLGLSVQAQLPEPDQIEITLRGPISGQVGETVRRAVAT